MTPEQRLQVLQQAGEVPPDADPTDWQLAQKTAWWGKPIDPVAFWRGRVAWLDPVAESSARQHGRVYPPMPMQDTSLPLHPDSDKDISTSWGSEGPAISFHETSLEVVFWDKFIKTHPWPPENLARQQFQVAKNTRKATPEEVSFEKARAARLGFPAEALDDLALFWSYALANRQQYQRLTEENFGPDSVPVTNLLSRAAIDPKYVTNAPSTDDLRAANTWKIAYLQRLRREKTDESYINAYLEAWSLSSNDVFGGSKGP